MAMLLIEQRLVIARDIASRVAVMGHGEIVFDGELDAFVQRTGRDARMARCRLKRAPCRVEKNRGAISV